MTARLEGRRAIVTGGASGIGRAIAVRLAQDGCDVGILDRHAADAADALERVRQTGRRAFFAQADVADGASAHGGIDQLTQALGAVDILVNNAGILRTAPFLAMPESQWHEVMGVNLGGVFHCCRAVLPDMIARRSGAIVNMASWTGKKGVPNHAAYSASKFAVIGLTQSLAGEVAAHGVRVNAVCPGIIVNTRMRDEAEALNRAQGLPDVDARVRTIPMQRAGEPEDVAGVVAFLASDDAAYMTGQALNITGGLWMA